MIFDVAGKEIVNTELLLTTDGVAIIDWNELNPDNALLPLAPGGYYYYINFKYDKTRTTFRSAEKFGGLGVITK
jgi:hypothetical protein